MERSLTIFRVRGIPVGINWSWLFIAALLSWILGSALFPATHPGLPNTAYLIMAVTTVVLFFLSVLLHELAHALIGLREGVRIEGITLWLLGGVARFTGGVPSPKTEFRMTIVGPLTSAALAAVFAVGAYALERSGAPSGAVAVPAYLGRINLILAGFNLVPALPLDGGRILRAYLWKRQGNFVAASLSAARAGRAFGVLLVWVGVLGFLTGAGLGGLWLVILGWFLLQAASSEASAALVQQTFAGKRVRDVMTPEPDAVDASWSLARFVAETTGPRGHATYPVLTDRRLAGLMWLRLAARVPPGERSDRTVGEVMLPRDRVATVGPDASVMDVLPVLRTPPGRAVVVEEADRVVGIVSPADITRALEIGQVVEHPAAPATRGASRGVWVVVALAMATVVGYLYHPPFAVLSPGLPIDVAGDIQIEGVPTSRINGEYVMLPVQVSRPNLFGVLLATFAADREVVPLTMAIPAGTDRERYSSEQAILHRESRELAAAAAARELGLPAELDGSGAVVVDIVSDSPADGKLQAGDVIVAVDGVPIRLATDLAAAIAARPPGTRFVIAIERDGLRQEIRIASRRMEDGRGGIGVVAGTRGLDVRLPFQIRFRERAVGGPSAALAYALAIVDILDPQDLAGGRTIAATGTIDGEGRIGPIGGIAAKLSVARTAEAELVLVPAGNAEEVADPGLRVVGVGSVAEALSALRVRS